MEKIKTKRKIKNIYFCGSVPPGVAFSGGPKGLPSGGGGVRELTRLTAPRVKKEIKREIKRVPFSPQIFLYQKKILQGGHTLTHTFFMANNI